MTVVSHPADAVIELAPDTYISYFMDGGLPWNREDVEGDKLANDFMDFYDEICRLPSANPYQHVSTGTFQGFEIVDLFNFSGGGNSEPGIMILPARLYLALRACHKDFFPEDYYTESFTTTEVTKVQLGLHCDARDVEAIELDPNAWRPYIIEGMPKCAGSCCA